MRTSSLGLALAAVASVSLATPEARANGRFPAAQVLLPSPADPNVLVLRATFGLLVSKDRGGAWDWICEGSVGYDPNEDPTLGVTQSGTIFAGAFKGLFATKDVGCNWGPAPGGITDPVVDIVVDKSNAHAALVLTSSYLGQDDAGSTFTSKIWSTTDDGAHWTQLGANLDPDVLPETIDVAPSDPTRVYVSGTRKVNGVVVGAFLASTNGGASFTATTFPMVDKVELAPFIAAVDPLDANRLYVRIKGTKGTRLLVTRDGGGSFVDAWHASGELLGFALSADGSKIYAGGPADGVNVASRSDMDALPDGSASDGGPGAFVKRSSIQLQCLVTMGAELWACSNEASGFVVGASTDDGATFAPKLHLCGVRGPLQCDPSSTTAVACDPLWDAQADNLGEPCSGGSSGGSGGSGSGGSSDGGSGSGGGNGAQAGGSGCALAMPIGAGATSLAGLGAVAALAAMRRRRRR